LDAPGAAPALDANISAVLASVDVVHHGRKVTIMRNQNQNSTVNPDFARTSRKCPPFCIQPGELSPGVKTIGELEELQFLKKINDGDALIMVVDSRTPDWWITEPFQEPCRPPSSRRANNSNRRC